MKFHEKLQKLRKEKGMSQEALAEMLDVSRQAVSKWESGQSFPETEKLIALSQIFGVTIDSLMKDGDMEQDRIGTVNEQFWVRRGKYYEYKSERTLFGLPLVHINIGLGFRRAKGILAIGNIATGYLSIGLISMGFVSLGFIGLGLISIATLGAGLLFSVGAIAAGLVAVGAIALGVFTLGALSIGMFSLGACSIASHIAIGDYAVGNIAVGRNANGNQSITVLETSRIFIDVSKEQIRNLINKEYPAMWSFITNLVSGLFH